MENLFKIYKHTSPSGKIYIGQTCLNSLIRRWRNGGKGYFTKDTKTGKYKQPYMVNAINKYPWNIWIHEVIDYALSLKEADDLETFYIEQYKSYDRNFGYNLTKGGRGHSGQPMRIETRQKLSNIVKELWNNPEYRNNVIKGHLGIPMHPNTKAALLKANTGKPCSEETKQKIGKANGLTVLYFSLDGKLLREFESCSEAGKMLGITAGAVNNCCLGKTKKCKSGIFLYKSEYEQSPEILLNRINTKRKTRGEPIIQYSLLEEFIEQFSSISEASHKTGIGITSISNCLTGRSKKAGGFLWKYKNKNEHDS